MAKTTESAKLQAEIDKLKTQLDDPDASVYERVRTRNALEAAKRRLEAATGGGLESVTDAGIAADDEMARVLETPIFQN